MTSDPKVKKALPGIGLASSIIGGTMANGNLSRAEWERVAGELRAYREAQEQTWGGLDDMTLARYLAGTCTPEERQTVEGEAGKRPAVAELLTLVRGALDERAPAELMNDAGRRQEAQETGVSDVGGSGGSARPKESGKPFRDIVGTFSLLSASSSDSARWRRRLAAVGALAACLAIGLVGGLAWNRSRDNKPFEVLVAQADSRSVGARGQPDEGKAVAIQSARKGFASVIALFNDKSPMVFPSRAAGAVPVLPGERVQSPPLPPGLSGAAVLLIVITEQPAAEVIRQSTEGMNFGPSQVGELQRILTEKLEASNYHWVAFASVDPKYPDRTGP
jgi:hypothetical protein